MTEPNGTQLQTKHVHAEKNLDQPGLNIVHIYSITAWVNKRQLLAWEMQAALHANDGIGAFYEVMMIFDTWTMSEWDHGLFQSSASHPRRLLQSTGGFGAAGVCFQISWGISSLTVNSAHNQAGSQMNSSIPGSTSCSGQRGGEQRSFWSLFIRTRQSGTAR